MVAGTMCSGSDLCLDVLRSVLRRCEAQLDHSFSCEIDAGCQTFIREFAKPSRLFTDVTEFGQDRVYDLVSCKCVPVPGSMIVYLGFSCKDVSYMNMYALSVVALATHSHGRRRPSIIRLVT